MTKTIQVRDLPDEVHRRLRVRAAEAGLSLSEYLRQEITHLSSRPTVREFLARAARGATSELPTEEAVAAVRQDRDSR